jgi:two-component system OmpR family response regulator
VADPCPLNADTLARVLAACGFRVRTAGTAAAALAVARADPPDVLVTEAAFPDGDGAALAHAVAAGRDPRPLLVLHSGRDPVQRWPGFDQVCRKPADPEALVRLAGGNTGA